MYYYESDESHEIITDKSLLGAIQGQAPKFPSFLNAVSKGAVTEGALIEMTITTADGKKYSSNLKLTPEDMQLVNDMKDLFSGPQGN